VIADLVGLRAEYPEVHEPVVSPDGEHLAVVVRTEEDDEVYGVWIDGTLWEEEFEKAWNLRFAPDGRLIALVRQDEEWTVGVDGELWEERFEFLWNLQLSGDGTVVAVQAKVDDAYTIAVDGRIWEASFPSCRDYAITPDGKHVAATVQLERLAEGDIFKFLEGLWTVAVDGTPWEARFLNVYGPLISDDGARVAAEVRLDIAEYTIAADARRWSEGYGMVWRPTFRAGTRKLLAPVRTNGSWTLAEDGVPLWKGRYVQLWHQRTSPDGVRIAAVVAPGFGRWTVAVDDHPWEITCRDMVDPPVFSPDGSRVAAAIKDGGRWTVAVDGKPWARDFAMVWDPVFSPDGTRVICRVEHEGGRTIAVDGHPWSQRFERLWEPAFALDGTGVLVRGVQEGRCIRQVLSLDELGG